MEKAGSNLVRYGARFISSSLFNFQKRAIRWTIIALVPNTSTCPAVKPDSASYIRQPALRPFKIAIMHRTSISAKKEISLFIGAQNWQKREGQDARMESPKHRNVHDHWRSCTNSRRRNSRWTICRKRLNAHAFSTEPPQINEKFLL